MLSFHYALESRPCTYSILYVGLWSVCILTWQGSGMRIRRSTVQCRRLHVVQWWSDPVWDGPACSSLCTTASPGCSTYTQIDASYTIAHGLVSVTDIHTNKSTPSLLVVSCSLWCICSVSPCISPGVSAVHQSVSSGHSWPGGKTIQV